MFKKDKNSFFIRNYVRDVFSKETLIAEGKKAHIDLQTRRINLLLINHIIKKVESTKEKYLDLPANLFSSNIISNRILLVLASL